MLHLVIIHFFTGVLQTLNSTYISFLFPILSVFIYHLTSNPYNRAARISPLAFILGSVFHNVYLDHLSSNIQIVDQSLSSNGSLLVQITNIPKTINNRVKYRVKIIFCSGKKLSIPVFLNISISTNPHFHFGDTLYITTYNSRFISPAFLYKSHPTRIRSTRNLTHLIIRNPLDVHFINRPNIFSTPLVWIRYYFMSFFLNDNLPSAFTLALLFGEQSHLNYKQWQILKDTSTAHLVAISGLHMTMLGRIFYRFVFYITHLIDRTNPMSTAEIFSCLCLIIYAIISGLPPSCQRAVLMAVFHCAQRFFYIRPQPLRTVFYCAFLQYLTDPGQISNIGFQLSYGMVISLLYVNQYFKHCKYRIVKPLLLPIISTLWSYFYWGNLILISPVANFFAVPWVSYLILPLSLLSVLLQPLCPTLSTYIYQLIDTNWSYLMFFLTTLSHFFPPIYLS